MHWNLDMPRCLPSLRPHGFLFSSQGLIFYSPCSLSTCPVVLGEFHQCATGKKKKVQTWWKCPQTEMNRKLLPGVLLQLHFCRPQFQASEQLMAGLSLSGFKVFLLQKAWKKCGHTSRAGSCSVRTGVGNERGGSWWSSVTVNLCCFLSAVLLFSMDKAAFWVTFEELLFFLFVCFLTWLCFVLWRCYNCSWFQYLVFLGPWDVKVFQRLRKAIIRNQTLFLPCLRANYLNWNMGLIIALISSSTSFYLFFLRWICITPANALVYEQLCIEGLCWILFTQSHFTCGKGIENPAPKNAMFITWWFQWFLTEKHSWQGFSG